MEAFESESHCNPGDIVVSKDMWSLLADFGTADPINGTVCMKLRSVVTPIKTSKHKEGADLSNSANETTIKRYVPAAVLPFLQAHIDGYWSSELRRVSGNI